MYLLLTDRRGTLSIRIQSTMHEVRMLIVEPNRKIRNNYCDDLKYESNNNFKWKRLIIDRSWSLFKYID